MVMTFREAADYFANLAVVVQEGIPEIAMAGAIVVQEEIKKELGHYQGRAGPYNAWQELNHHTEEERTRMGFTADDPLLMTGRLRDSIKIVPIGDAVLVGSDLPYAKHLEFGTARMPPRPFIGRAAFVKQAEILEAQAEVLASLLGL